LGLLLGAFGLGEFLAVIGAVDGGGAPPFSTICELSTMPPWAAA